MNELLVVSMLAVMMLSMGAMVDGMAIRNQTRIIQDLEAQSSMKLGALKICMGQTELCQWTPNPFDGNTIDVIVNTTHCRFKSTPFYFTSLTGNRFHFRTLGASSIYYPTATSFSVAIRILELLA